MFITFEGPDGSGKTSQVAELADYLIQAGYPVLASREPGGTPIGEKVRIILHDLGNVEMNARTEILLYQASRAQLVEQIILPHLSSGGIVLCDRYADSTLAYQGYGYQRDLIQLRTLVDFATGGLKPDLTFLLDVDVEIGLQRRARGGEWNRLDAYELTFHQRVRQGYLALAQEEPERWIKIDAGRPYNEVQQALRSTILERLEKYREAAVGRP